MLLAFAMTSLGLLAPAAPLGDEGVVQLRAPRHFEDATGDLPSEPVTAVAVDPQNDLVLFAGMDGFLFGSHDGGETWRPLLSFPRGTAVDRETDIVDSDGIDGSDDLPDGAIDVASGGARATEDASSTFASLADD